MMKKTTEKKSSLDSKEFVVMNINPEDYKVFDLRANKPICLKKNSLEQDDGSAVMQEIDTIQYSSKAGKKHSLEYFSPNNVGILLSVANKARLKAKKIFDEYFLSNDKKTDTLDKKDAIIIKSTILYDYIEQAQTCIVFGYTALEAFTNLSIPEDYQYTSKPNNKGVVEIYDKRTIERWLPLKTKLIILTDIYKTKCIKKNKIWDKFLEYENLRHDIIHQKSIATTSFYKSYFSNNFFDKCTAPEDVIKYFFEEKANKEFTNPLWPWVINAKNEFPFKINYKEEDFLITGNIYEGKK